MGRKKSQGPVFDFEPVIEYVGLGQLIEQIGVKRIIEELGVNRFIEELGVKRFIAELDLDGLEALIAELTPEQRQQLKQRL